ncbi:hypothetical protein [Kitasatospora cinereorecta]
MNSPAGPERTPDGRYVVVNHRRWRATDPDIPPGVSSRLRHHLMAAAERRARERVHVAKVALGERGTPWWEQSTEERRRRWEKGVAELDSAEPEADGPQTDPPI